MRSSSFYVNCDAFSAAADASRRGVDTFLDDETLKTRLKALHQLDNAPDEALIRDTKNNEFPSRAAQVIAEAPFQLLKMASVDHAAKWCAEDPQCTGLCYNADTGWVHVYHGQMQRGYTKLKDGTKGSVCLALNGFGPPGTGMREEMRPCFQSLEAL
eukprot:g25422.t1